MSHNGKKLENTPSVTNLFTYNLDVRLDVEGNMFIMLIPTTPGGPIDSPRQFHV